MASEKVSKKNARLGSSRVSNDELLDELASFLYDAYLTPTRPNPPPTTSVALGSAASLAVAGRQ